MLVVRGTEPLQKRLGATYDEEAGASTTVLGDWFATALFWRPQVVMLVNERTLLPVFLPLVSTKTLFDRIPDAIAMVLYRHGVDEELIATEVKAMGEIRFTAASDPDVVRELDDLGMHAKIRSAMEAPDLVELSLLMSRFPVEALSTLSGSPDRELAMLLGHDPSSSARSRPAPAGTAAIHQLKVTLLRTKPPIWRRILVDPRRGPRGDPGGIRLVELPPPRVRGGTGEVRHPRSRLGFRSAGSRRAAHPPRRDRHPRYVVPLHVRLRRQLGARGHGGEAARHRPGRAPPRLHRRSSRLPAGGLRRNLGIREPAAGPGRCESPRARLRFRMDQGDEAGRFRSRGVRPGHLRHNLYEVRQAIVPE